MLVTGASGRVIAERSGDAPPRVLALHGWGRTRRDWAPSLGGLPYVAADLPGFGDSPAPDAAEGSAWYAEAVSDLLRKLGPMVVVGHSFGGRVAVELAAKHPELVRGIVLTGAPLVRTAPPVKPSMKVRVAKKLSSRGLVPQAILDRVKQSSGSADYRAAQGVMRDVLVRVLHEDYDPALRALACPVVCVYGELDTAAPPAVAHAIAARVPGTEVRIVPGQPHQLTGELGDAIRAAVDDLLVRLDADPTLHSDAPHAAEEN